MEESKIIDLFNSMKKAFDCEKMILKTYTDAFSNVSYAFSRNVYDFEVREAERWAVARVCSNVVSLNLSVAQKLPLDYIEEVLIHEITHYLLLPKDTSNHPPEFWEEFDNNCKIWQKKKRRI